MIPFAFRIHLNLILPLYKLNLSQLIVLFAFRKNAAGSSFRITSREFAEVRDVRGQDERLVIGIGSTSSLIYEVKVMLIHYYYKNCSQILSLN